MMAEDMTVKVYFEKPTQRFSGGAGVQAMMTMTMLMTAMMSATMTVMMALTLMMQAMWAMMTENCAGTRHQKRTRDTKMRA